MVRSVYIQHWGMLQYRKSVQNSSLAEISRHIVYSSLISPSPNRLEILHWAVRTKKCRQNYWATNYRILRTNEISSDLDLRWVSEGYPMWQHIPCRRWQSFLQTINHLKSDTCWVHSAVIVFVTSVNGSGNISWSSWTAWLLTALASDKYFDEQLILWIPSRKITFFQSQTGIYRTQMYSNNAHSIRLLKFYLLLWLLIKHFW